MTSLPGTSLALGYCWVVITLQRAADNLSVSAVLYILLATILFCAEQSVSHCHNHCPAGLLKMWEFLHPAQNSPGDTLLSLMF